MKQKEPFVIADTRQDHKIPPIVYQCWITKDLKGNMKKCVEKNIKQNPKLTFSLSDHNDCETFIANHFNSSVVDAYRRLIPGAYKADLWRYCVIYMNGGIYMDIKLEINDHCDLYHYCCERESDLFVNDIESSGSGVINGFFACSPKNPKLLFCINKIVENVNNNYYGDSALLPTGPLLLKQAFSEEELKLFDYRWIDTWCNSRQGFAVAGKIIQVVLVMVYPNYKEEQNSVAPHYFQLWNDRKIYA